MKQITQELTFNLNRACLHCGSALPDQYHASQKFCERQVLQDGSIDSCKDDYHSGIRKEVEAPYRRIAAFQKQAHQLIEQLFNEKGEIVTGEEINWYGINLYRPVEFSYVSGLFTFFFKEYAIEQIGNNNCKIYKHGKVF